MRIRILHPLSKKQGDPYNGPPLKLSLDLGCDEVSNRSQRFIHLGGILAAAHGRIGLAAAVAAADSADVFDDLTGLDTGLDRILAADSQEGDLICVRWVTS